MGCSSASSGDNLYQQLFPFTAWGKTYYTAPFIYRAYDIYRVLVQDPAEPVYVNGVALSPSLLIAGRYYEINIMGNNTPRIISSNKPICVFQYLITQNCDGVNSDPEMIALNPIEQTLNDITVMSARRDLTPPNTNITNHYLNIIFKTNSFNSLKIDGAIPKASPKAISGTPYSYIQEDVTASTTINPAHRITSDSGFICIAYGYGNVESYGYNAGANVKDLYQFVSIKNQYAVVDFPATCKNTPFAFSMTFPYQPTQIKWLLSTIGYPDVTVSSPVYDSTYILNGKTLYNYKLPNTYKVNNTGTYSIKVLAQNPNSDGCGDEQEIQYDLEVYERPYADIVFDENVCVGNSTQFTDNSNGNNRPVIKWSWEMGDNSSAVTKNPAHLYATAGSFDARLSVITDIGCISDTITKTVTIDPLPVATFDITTPGCVNRAITFADASTSAGSAIAKWYWNFGDGTPQVVSTNNNALTHTYSAIGTYIVTLVVETTKGCKSTMISKPIVVNYNPVAAMSFTNTCLPGGSMSFNNNSWITGGSQADLQYNWNFGDGDFSTALAPVHVYTTTGPFNVTLIVKSMEGCTDTTIQGNSLVFAQPKASFSVNDKTNCLDKSFEFNNTSTAINATVVQWFWSFGDGTTSTEKNPSKKYSLPGIYTVKLYVQSDKGCISDTATETIQVYALPTSRFTTPSISCATKDISFIDQSVANEGKIIKWIWNFGTGDPDVIQTTNAPFTKVYTLAGSYSITLLTETDLGCTSPVLDTIISIHPQPIPGFAMSANCLIDPYSEFTDTSKVATGTIKSWLWNFGDPDAVAGNANTSVLQHSKHKYAKAITYMVSQTVTSDKGCVASLSQPFTINGSKPQPGFQLSGGNTQCSNDSVVLTNNSIADVGKIVKLEIYWDYLNNPLTKITDDNPVVGKQYHFKYPEFFTPATKSYTIKVIAYSGINCLKDSIITVDVKNTPAITFNPLNAICGNAPVSQLSPAFVTNSIGGQGTYTGSGMITSGQFNPVVAGPGSHIVRYTHTGANGCSNYKEQPVLVYPAPTASAGLDKIILEGGSETLKGFGSGTNIKYQWTPAQWLSSDAVPEPKTNATDNIVYKLTVTSSDGCTASDDVLVKVLKGPTIPNVFTPNGDGINDRWNIKYLETYPSATVEVYNRYGQLTFKSKGYSKPWDGTFNGKLVPAGTYYYIVSPGSGRKQMSGFVDVLR